MFAPLVAVLPFLALATAAPFNKRADNQQIHINGDKSKCLAVEKLENGAPVVNVACDNGFKNGWTIQNGNNDHGVRLTGTEFCLDAGEHPGNNGQAKIWTCYPGLSQQTWWYTDDKHLAITGGDQCLDVGQDHVQTYQCIGYNTNQIWTLGDAPAPPTSSTTPPPSSSSAPPPSSSSAPPPSSSSAPPPNPTGTQIHFKGSSEGCLQIGGGGFGGEGTGVYISNCAPSNTPVQLSYQQFDIKRNTPGVIRSTQIPDFCLDAGDSGVWTNGSGITIRKCNPDRQQQQWYYTDDNHLAVVGGNQCLNVKRESTPQPLKPYSTYQDLQTWQCDGPDAQQIFTI